ncbi:MAG: SRPBCC domain-containing protein [Deltaproteobacteria bacterium]|nr:SRPBCC domain-containing protein [Deltaproteobacteria bacterium]
MIRRTLEVKTPPARAFEAWTRDIHLWWPPGHTAHQGRVVLTPEQFVEQWDGGERSLGRVVDWSPPARLVYDFYLGSSPQQPTRVSIHFTAVSTGTRVDIEHVAHAVPPEEFARTAVGFLAAWPHVESAYAAFIHPEHP